MKDKKTGILKLAAMSVALGLTVGCTTAAKKEEARNPSALPFAQTPALKTLAALSKEDLAKTFAAGTADVIPEGVGQGVPIFVSAFTPLSTLGEVLWGGKVFDPVTHTLKNKLPFGTKGIQAKVYKGELGKVIGNSTGQIVGEVSKDVFEVDGKPSIILDYHQTASSVFRGIIDEIRQVLPDEYPSLYLGRATLDGNFVCYFALDFSQSK